MCRTLRILILSTLFLIPEAGASVDRLAVLGGLSQPLLDDSNSFIFPATLNEWPRFEVELFDDWAGLAYPLSPQHTLGLFLNRPTPELATLNETISQNGSDLFRALSPSPWLDLAYSYNPKPGLSIGTSVALAYDRKTQGPRTASVVNSDFRIGMRVGQPRGPAPLSDSRHRVSGRRAAVQRLGHVRHSRMSLPPLHQLQLHRRDRRPASARHQSLK